MTTDALREAQAAYDAAKAEFSSRYRQDYRIPVEAVSPSTNAAAALIAAQQARIAALEAERDAALLLADALDKALQAEGVNDVIAQLRLSVFRRKLDAQLRDGISSVKADEDAAGGAT